MPVFPELPSATDLARAVTTGDATPRALLQDALARIEAARDLNAVVSLNDGAAAQADAVAARVAAGERLPLAGVPVLVKDNINVTGTPTTCGSRILQGYVSPYDATAAARLTAAGAGLPTLGWITVALHLLAIGDSVIDGVGCPSVDQALTGHFARKLAQVYEREVRWRALGRTGACARVPRIPPHSDRSRSTPGKRSTSTTT
jgi:hypothetical protein